jgi:hypothetical protein
MRKPDWHRPYALETDWLAEVVGLELRNVVAKYPFERSHRFPMLQPNSGRRDYSRSSCGVEVTQTFSPSAPSNSRRPMLTVIRPSRARCVKGRIPRHGRAVLTARHPARAGARRAPDSTDRRADHAPASSALVRQRRHITAAVESGPTIGSGYAIQARQLLRWQP